MRIDVLIATHNRAQWLGPCLDSVIASALEASCETRITIIDNNSTDDTAAVVTRASQGATIPVRYLFESRLGKSHAVNAGMQATDGEVLAFADDDQVMSRSWIASIARSIEAGFDFVSGPVIGDWGVPPPPWYDDRLRGVLSLCDYGPEPFIADRRDVFSGGNAAVTRHALLRTGGFHPVLGKIAGSFSMCEDGELLLRLKEAGFRGVYEPAMRVVHRVPRERISRRYFRRWHRGYGLSMARVHSMHPLSAPYLLGVPRFLYRRFLEAIPQMIASRLRGDLPGAFAAELQLWFSLGYLNGAFASNLPKPAPDLALGREP